MQHTVAGRAKGRDEYLFVGKITTVYQVLKIENDDRIWFNLLAPELFFF